MDLTSASSHSLNMFRSPSPPPLPFMPGSRPSRKKEKFISLPYFAGDEDTKIAPRAPRDPTLYLEDTRSWVNRINQSGFEEGPVAGPSKIKRQRAQQARVKTKTNGIAAYRRRNRNLGFATSDLSFPGEQMDMDGRQTTEAEKNLIMSGLRSLIDQQRTSLDELKSVYENLHSAATNSAEELSAQIAQLENMFATHSAQHVRAKAGALLLASGDGSFQQTTRGITKQLRMEAVRVRFLAEKNRGQ